MGLRLNHVLGALLAAAAATALFYYRAYRRAIQLYEEVFDDQNDYALIYSMAKVGSTSLWVAIARNREMWAYYDELNETYQPIAKTHEPLVAEDWLRKVPAGRRIWLFTAVRDPTRRLVSSYFEDIEMRRHLGNRSQEEILAMNVSELEWDMFNKWHVDLHDRWFSFVLKSLIGVDLTQQTFPFELGRMVVEGSAFGKPVIVVLLRAEDVDSWWDIMRHTVPWWITIHKQDAKELWYGPLYKEFKKNFHWPGWAVHLLSLGDSKHFYTIAERAVMFKKAMGEKITGMGA